MLCYRRGCKEPCDELKKMYCIYRLNQAQAELMDKLKHSCSNCQSYTVKARINKKRIRLCTSCKNIEKGMVG